VHCQNLGRRINSQLLIAIFLQLIGLIDSNSFAHFCYAPRAQALFWFNFKFCVSLLAAATGGHSFKYPNFGNALSLAAMPSDSTFTKTLLQKFKYIKQPFSHGLSFKLVSLL
jgi:hypothetical protein